ncbi:MAG: radical SAM protein [Nostoc sp. DedQUE08]|uniref:radical SAM protein n=1 Tax=unclassified Nostoc TaxID=2593658 RepID=UPI002AD2AB63|nr:MULTISPECIES: radical SAM protein [unclassified Nostoc]MDZ8064888.1 radical SAM protein [Nostoc sp. DedQUE08]MDZ8093958.1 radical SAM protein [Nostoc sp. DedQUE05]
MVTQTVESDVQDSLMEYLEDPFLNHLFKQIRKAEQIRGISVDLTHACNLRCQGCYFFLDELDQFKAPKDEAEFDTFIAHEKSRGTNFITVVGGEPSLMLERLQKLYQNFRLMVVTNALIKIPYEGFETMPIAISLWGDRETDKTLRGGGKLDVFSKALKNYKDDPRAIWHYTTTPGNAHEIASVVEQCVANGNRVLFNFYSDRIDLGGVYDHNLGFADVRREIDKAIARYPDKILMTSYMSSVFTTQQLYDETWGYEVCTSLTVDHEINQNRIKNGKRYNPHYRAYNPDLKSTRRCCTGDNQDCSTCYQTWAQVGWIMINLERHLGSKQEFTNWLTTTYLFYLMCRMVDFESGVQLLPEIHQRIKSAEFC